MSQDKPENKSMLLCADCLNSLSPCTVQIERGGNSCCPDSYSRGWCYHQVKCDQCCGKASCPLQFSRVSMVPK